MPLYHGLVENRKPTQAERMNQGMQSIAQQAQQYQQQQQTAKALQQMGVDPSVMHAPPEAQAAYFKQQFAPEKTETALQQSQRQLNEEKLNALKGNQKLFDKLRGGGQQEQASQGQMPQESSSPGLEQADEATLREISAFAGQPGQEGTLGNMAKSELERRKEKEKIGESRREALQKETFPVRKELADRAEIARRGLENKEDLMRLIETGNLDDPTVATILEALPFNLGKRFMTPETIEYKGGLVQGYGDLKNIFSGATRVKEIDILENKIADIYLTDEQKKSVLRSMMKSLKADIVKADAAAELEEEGKSYGVLQYNKEVNKRAKPKLDALFDSILDEQKAIIKDAENKKKLPLNVNDPEDLAIIDQILMEVGGDPKKAEALAKKKGYRW